MSLKEQTEKLRELVMHNRKLLDLSESEGREDLSPEQQTEYEAREKDIDALEKKIESAQKLSERKERLSQLESKLDEKIGRQVATSQTSTLTAGTTNLNQVIELAVSGNKLRFEPGTIDHLRCQKSYEDKFNRYLLTGESNGLSDWSSLGLTVNTDSKGGYLVPMTFMNKMIKFLDDNVWMRQLATVISGVSPSGIGIPSYDTDPGDADWTSEVLAEDADEDDAMTFGNREMIPQDLMKVIAVSRKMLRAGSPVIDIENFIVQRLGYKFAITEEKAAMTGDGVRGWLGIFTASANGITTSQDIRSFSATAFDGDDVIETLGDLKEEYQANATWAFGRAFLKRCRKLKASSSGEYIWTSPFGGNPGLIGDRPYKISEYAPSTYTADQYVAVVGDYKTGYYVADGLDMTVDRDDSIRRLKKQHLFVGEKSSDGAPVLAEAFRRLQMKAS